MRKTLLRFYNKFHKRTIVQKEIIGDKNFTYRNLIGVLQKYTKSRDEILDIGCGAGTVDFYLANQGHKILGIDVSKRAIEICKRSARALNLEDELTFKRLTFPQEKPSGNFDVVICSEVLEHLENDKKAVEVIFNLLRSGGVVVISVPSKNAPLYKIGLAKEFDRKVGHLRRYSMKEIEILVSRMGFVVQETKKTEGVLRNFFFLNPIVGRLVKVLNKIRVLSDMVTFIDSLTISLFGESQIFVVARRP